MDNFRPEVKPLKKQDLKGSLTPPICATVATEVNGGSGVNAYGFDEWQGFYDGATDSLLNRTRILQATSS